ncbi:MAG: S-layer homology domain-containing protein [Lachnoclostridium sp.]
MDVPADSWYRHYVEEMYWMGLMTGMDPTHFGPDRILCRGQFVTVLYRIESEPWTEYSPVFPDVQNGEFYTSPVLWASRNGIVTGYTDTGNFGPSDKINREQLAVMMYKYAKYMNYDVSQKADFGGFSDADRVNEFAKEAMQWAVGTGIITGKDNGTRLDPQGNASRAECATIIMRFLERYGK